MQTKISHHYAHTAQGQEVDRILRNCVHCGFCTATCPTYQLLGDELDSPRGRIYLIKQLFEGNEVTQKTQTHLDRCLSCRSCETTCPSGVQYGRLLDLGREVVEQKVKRSLGSRAVRYVLRSVIPYPKRFARLLKLGQWFKPVLPRALKLKIPTPEESLPWPNKKQRRRILVVEGCAQSVVTPATNAASARVMQKLGIQLIREPKAGCCGAVSHHLSAVDESLNFVRRNIDAWWPHVEQGVEAILSTASGCGVMLKDYGHLLSADESYAAKAKRISELSKDISEVLREEDLSQVSFKPQYEKVAFHSPCSLQHGQKLAGVVEKILSNAGYALTQVNDAHLCCGSAGTYSILQSKLSQQLLNQKLASLQQEQPAVIASANIGCQMHLATKANVPVRHWIELLDEAMV